MSTTDQSGFFGLGSFADGISGGSALLKLWLEGQQSAFQSIVAAAAPAPGTTSGDQDGTLQPLTELWKSSMEKWLTLTQQQTSEQSSEETLRKLFDPSQWVKASQDPFHNAIEHLTSGPSYATLWDMDKKMLRAQQLRLEQERNIGAYHAIVRTSWKKAYDLFLDEIKKEDGAPIKSWRETTDLWVAIANQVLIDMHRTPEFLEAQRRMTRSATDYRLQEREIVEAFCDAHHIPTRTEVDEVQHTVHELRRQVRQLQRSLNEMQTGQNTTPVPATHPAGKTVSKKAASKTPQKSASPKPASTPKRMKTPKANTAAKKR